MNNIDMDEAEGVKPKPFRTKEDEKPGYKNKLLRAIDHNLDTEEAETLIDDPEEAMRILEEKKVIEEEEKEE